MQRFGVFLVRVCLISVIALMTTGVAQLTPASQAAPLATFTVNRTDDIAPRGTGLTCLNPASTDCTLREAIIKANTDPGSTIVFASSINGTPITLSRAGDDDTASLGDLDVTASLIIIGNGTANTIIQAGTNSTNGIDKVLALNPVCDHVVNVTISGVTVRYGRNATPPNYTTYQHTGGGIDWCNYGSSTFNFSDSIVSNNTAVTSYGGGLNIDGVAIPAGTGTVTLSNLVFDHNQTISTTATANGGGVNIYGPNLNITISNSTFTGNTVTNSQGGAIFFQPSRNGSLTIHSSSFSDNSAGSRGGAIAVNLIGDFTQAITLDQGTVITGNTTGTYIGSSPGVAEGGGVYLVSDSANDAILLSNITVTNNSEYSGSTDKRGGGGIAAGNLGGTTTIVNSRIVGNTASSGSGVHKDLNNGTLTAINNWWGCNAGPGGTGCDTAIMGGSGSGSPSLNFNPWLVLGLSVSPTSLVLGGTSTLTADVTHNSGSGSGYSIPNGTTVTFAASSPDTISPSTLTTSAGTATSTFTANAVGSRTASVTLDNQTVTTTLNVCANTLTVTNANDTGAGSLRDALANTCANGTINFNGNYTLAPASTLATSKIVTIDSTGHTVSISGTFEFATNAALAGPLTLNNLQIDSGRTITANTGSSLNVTGNWINSGTLNADNGTVIFSGNGLQNLTANSATTFNNLTINSGVILVETVSTDNVTVAGTLTNNGTLRKSQAVSGTGLKTFGLAGAYNGGTLSIDVATQGGMSSLQVDRIDSNHPDATYGPGNGTSTGRWWTITQTGGSGYVVDLTLPHSVATPANADVCEYTAGPGYGWDCDRTSSTANTVTRQNVTSLSPWAVGDNTGPTAITLTSLSVRSSSEASPLIGLIGVIGLGTIGVVARKRRSRTLSR